MRTIYTLGESLLDIIFKNNQPLTAKAGGSMLNTAISLGRLNQNIYHISELGADNSADIIKEFLSNNNVNTKLITEYNNSKTALALAFLDANNNASYSIYKDYPNERTLIIPDFNNEEILLYGSIYAITFELRNAVINILNKAKENNVLLIYDPNIRKNHLNNDDKIRIAKEFIEENIRYATIVKASDEDLMNIYGNYSLDTIYDKIKELGCKNLIITENKKGVHLYFSEGYFHYKVPQITPISTIGAGDSFNAGIIYTINKLNLSIDTINNLNKTDWDKIIKTGIIFATDVCKSYENYISDTIKTIY